MAETYRGLTIRIGGDATSLQKALRSVNSSISSTEAQLRKMRQALNMDPGNMEAIETNLQLVGQRAVEAQSRLSQLRRAVQEVGSQKVELLGGKESTQTVRELADATEDAAERAANARRNYAEVVEQLAQVRNEIQSVTGIDLDDELNPDEAVQSMRELGMISDDLADTYSRLRSSYEAAFNENEVAKAVAQMRDLETETTKAEAQADQLASRFSELSRATSGMSLGGDVEERLRQVDAAAEAVADELERVDRALDMDPGNVDAVSIKMRDLVEASTLSEERMELLQSRLSEMNAEGIGRLSDETDDLATAALSASEEYDRASEAVVQLRGHLSDLRSQQGLLEAKDEGLSDEYRELDEQIRAAEAQLESLVATQREAQAAFESASQVQEYRDLQVEIAETRSEQSRLNDEMAEMSRFSGITAGSLTSLGMSLSSSVTPAILAMGYGMTQATYDIDAAYRDMRKTVDGTEQQFEELRQAAIDFSTTHVTSADQILSIQAIGGELGVATEDLKVFAETVSNIDVATNLDAEEAATALGQLSNILSDLSSDKFPNFSDALVRLGNNGASTESQIADIASRIGAMGSIVGMTTPEILAWSSTVASTGQGAEAAGTAISKTISDIETAVASGGDSLEAFASVAQMSAEDFARAWEETPSDAMHAFIDGLNVIEDSGGSAITTLGELGITSVRQVQAIQGLMQMIGGLNDNLAMSEDAWNGVSDEWGEAGDAAREAEAKAEGFSGAIDRMKNVAQALGDELGESLVPAVDGVADILGDLYDWFAELPDAVKQGIVVFGAFTAALGPMILLGKGVVEFLSGVGKGLTALGTAAKAAKSIEGLSSAMSAATTATAGLSTGLAGIGTALAVGGVVALVAAFADEASKASERERKMTEATEALANASKVATGDISGATEAIEGMSDVTYRSTSAVDDAVDSLYELGQRFKEIDDDANQQIYSLRSARDAIEQYGGASDLTTVQQETLSRAIETVNSQCGTNYSVVKDAGGAYQIMEDGAVAAKDAIYDLIDAQIYQAQVDAQMDKLTETYKEQAEQAEAYADQLAVVQRLREELAKYPEDATGNMAGNRATIESQLERELGTLEELRGVMDDTTASAKAQEETINNLGAAASGAVEGFDQLVQGSVILNELFETTGRDMEDFADDLEATGISLEQFKGMNEADLATVAAMWDGTTESIMAAIGSLDTLVSDSAVSIHDALMSLDDGEVAAALEGAGVNITSLSNAMYLAGIDAQTLNQIGSENFAALAANCGGSIDTLIWMIQNYNAQPIYNKDGSINVNDVPLVDALANTYTWNGTTLNTLNGQVVIQTRQITDAQGLVYTWNEQGKLVDPEGKVVVDTTQIELANGEIAEYNNGVLDPKTGEVYVGFDTLTDCLGNMVEYKNTELNPIEGEVYCDYSELSSALGEIQNLKGQNGYKATVYLNTVRTTTQRTVVEPVTQSSASGRSVLTPSSATMSLPPTSVALPASVANTASPLARAAVLGADAAVAALSDDPSYFSSVSRSVVSRSSAPMAVKMDGGGASGGGAPSGAWYGESSTREVVGAINALRSDLADMGVYLDSGKLVGGISKDVNKSLGRIQRRGSLA